MNSLEHTFQDRLKEAMSASKFETNTELAEASGVSNQTIGNYLTGRRFPRGLTEVLQLAKSLNVSLDYLCGISDDAKDRSTSIRMETYEDLYRIIAGFTTMFLNSSISIRHHESPEIDRIDGCIESADGDPGRLYPYDELQILIDDPRLCEFYSKLAHLQSLEFNPVAIDLFSQQVHDEMKETRLPSYYYPFEV